MSILRKILIALVVFVVVVAAALFVMTRGDTANLSMAAVTGLDPELAEPDAQTIPTVSIAEPVGWADGEVPRAAEGLAVTRFAEGLNHPRTMHRLPNGDVLVSLTGAPASEKGGGFMDWIAGKLMSKAGANVPSANQVVLMRDGNGDGVAETKAVLVDGLSSPSGLAWADDTLYVANHDAVLAFPYKLGGGKIEAAPRKLMDLPPGQNHWMRNVELSPDGTKLYIAVGSASNIAEKGMDLEKGRAAIWEYNLETDTPRQFAVGLRNPNGLDFNPWSGELWTTVNERDMLGSDLVPDYLTNVPVGAQYGWPWVYYKDNFDRRVEAPVPAYLTEYARRPEFALGPHVAALGLVFSAEGNRMGDAFGQGAFIARHGSWNRKPPSGYDVVYVAFDERGNPKGKPVPVLTGFLNDNGTTKGRPTWAEWAGDGSLLISDDTAGIIWRVFAPGAAPAAKIVRKKSSSLRPQEELTGDPRAAAIGKFGEDDYAREEPAQ